LSRFASEGLRVLCFGVRKLTLGQFEEFKEKHEAIRRQKGKDQKDKMLRLFDTMEQDLKYIGISAIEDKLQDEVGETIESLRNAGINVWMLTGDKMETAIEIAKSCNLFDHGMTQLIFSFSDMLSIT